MIAFRQILYLKTMMVEFLTPLHLAWARKLIGMNSILRSKIYYYDNLTPLNKIKIKIK